MLKPFTLIGLATLLFAAMSCEDDHDRSGPHYARHGSGGEGGSGSGSAEEGSSQGGQVNSSHTDKPTTSQKPDGGVSEGTTPPSEGGMGENGSTDESTVDGSTTDGEADGSAGGTQDPEDNPLPDEGGGTTDADGSTTDGSGECYEGIELSSGLEGMGTILCAGDNFSFEVQLVAFFGEEEEPLPLSGSQVWCMMSEAPEGYELYSREDGERVVVTISTGDEPFSFGVECRAVVTQAGCEQSALVAVETVRVETRDDCEEEGESDPPVD